MESILKSTFTSLNESRPLHFRSLFYDACLQQYGSDKPDLRIPFTLLPISSSLYSPTVRKAV